MLKWLDVIKYANKGNLTPDKRVEKTDEEWKALLTEEQYYITRQKGTERANSSDLCTFFEAGKYTCVTFKNYWVTTAAKPQKYIPMSVPKASNKSKVHLIICRIINKMYIYKVYATE